MNKEFLQNWTKVTKTVQQPLQSLMELNLKTLQKFNYLKPNELTKIQGAEDLIQKQMHIMLENGHNVFNYMKETFDIFDNIFEKTLSSINEKSMSNDFFNLKKSYMTEATEAIKKTMPMTAKPAQSKKATPKKKTTVKAHASSTKTAGKKSTTHRVSH